MYQTIISVDELRKHKNQQDWVVVDCRCDLANLSSGYQSYLESHIAGAIYADIYDHLSGKPITDHGRHPMPTADKLQKVFSSFGINEEKQVVVYDASAGSFAARLWWLLRYMGHRAVAVLDGGWQAWQSAGLAVETVENKSAAASFCGRPRSDWLVTIDDVAAAPLLVDSRDAARYCGEMEPIDPIAGHIPGAINHCWKENLKDNGHFLDSRQLRQQFSQIYVDTTAEQVVFYCGSGVTACHNLLAVAHAGLPAARLYAGSWSEWCKQADRPIAIGPKPA
jgi:thiosulfate/3-mercaptopyruvate sulfurtransferase